MYMISSCLAGVPCRYDGKHSEHAKVMELVHSGQAVLVCPEQLGGLPTPRACCEICRNADGEKQVVDLNGRNYTMEYQNGAEKCLDIAQAFGIKKAILKAKSPSCGYGTIYDGTFSGKLIEGSGLLAELLSENGIDIMTETDL